MQAGEEVILQQKSQTGGNKVLYSEVQGRLLECSSGGLRVPFCLLLKDGTRCCSKMGLDNAQRQDQMLLKDGTRCYSKIGLDVAQRWDQMLLKDRNRQMLLKDRTRWDFGFPSVCCSKMGLEVAQRWDQIMLKDRTRWDFGFLFVCCSKIGVLLGVSSECEKWQNKRQQWPKNNWFFSSCMRVEEDNVRRLFKELMQGHESRCNPSEGVIWTKAKTCSFWHERCNYSHVTSSNCTQPSFKLLLTI